MCTLRSTSQIAVALPRKPFQQIPSANAAAGELRAFLHHVENCVFSRAADYGHAAQIDQQFAPVQIAIRVFPRCVKFAHPRIAELSFHNQLALCSGVYDGNFEH